MKIIRNFILILLTASSVVCAQINSPKNTGVYVDVEGVMRWKGTDEEVGLFGVNYTVPFAYSYRALKRLHLDPKKAIDIDIAQFKRLDLDAFRVHMWDREISDSVGNVLQNEHLDLFDYLLAKLSENGIKSIITPIAWWGTAWPEQDFKTPGFSDRYSKVEMVTNPKAREAQRNYLKQIINHVNPYTKYSYKNDPSIIAVEIINEPHHPSDTARVTDYINEMYDILRSAGLTKPIFYNISENWSDSQAKAVVRSKVQGVSFQWYPTGLVHNKRLEGNYLINVNKYAIPSKGIDGFGKKAKMVYEFDAADIGDSYMYPAMIRSYREAGMQFAAMFSYDPSQIAWSNTEYSTHFLNLLYAPAKAIGLMIAGKAFHKIPRMKSYGNFPQNNSFGNFRVSYKEDLSELNSPTEFLYSNNTSTIPVSINLLKQIAGTGSSEVVNYNGTGAYFLDKMENGIWKLEVYPDVLWIRDPFEPASMSRQAARLFWNQREMKINLPDLGNDFTIRSLIDENISKAGQNGFSINPGIYLLEAKNVKSGASEKYLSQHQKFLDGLYIPFRDSNKIYVVNDTKPYLTGSHKPDFKFKIASERKIDNAYLFVKRIGWRGFEKHTLINVNGFDYRTVDSSIVLQPGKLEYCVAVETKDGTFTFPEGIKSVPGDWDFYTNRLWNVNVIGKEEPIVLLDAYRDRKDFIFSQVNDWRKLKIDFVNGETSEQNALNINVSLSEKDTLAFGIQLNVAKYINSLGNEFTSFNQFSIKARSQKESSCNLTLVLLTSDGKSLGADVKLNNSWNVINIPFENFKTCNALILPNAYPKFLPKVWHGSNTGSNLKNEMKNLQFIQILYDAERNGNAGSEFEIESISIKK